MRFSARPRVFDVLMAAAVVSASLLSLRVLPGKTGGGYCYVHVNGRPYLKIDLSQDAPLRDTLRTEFGVAVVEKSGHRVRFAFSSCPHGVCMDRGFIGRPGESIVCAPNRVLAVISADKEPWDAISR